MRRLNPKPAICAVALLASGVCCFAEPAGGGPGGSGGHPSDPFFALDHVLDVTIWMAPVDWHVLRHQRFDQPGRYGGADCRSRPFPEDYSWFAADITLNGLRYGEVGIRKKGWQGSVGWQKPSLKLGFDKFVEDQALGGVLTRVTLNNGAQDESLLSTCLAYQVFAAAGLPAPRCNYARVAVNGENLGIYVHVEDIEYSLLERAFTDAGGNLYEGVRSDFRPGFRGTIEKKTNRDASDWSDVDAVIAALQDPSPAGLAALAAVVDLDRFLTFWAAEVLVGHGDGYAGYLNNFQFYREPDRRFVFIPWGVDRTFRPGVDAVLASGAIANRLYRDVAWRAAYEVRLRELLDTVWDETELLRRSERMAAIVQAHARHNRGQRAARGADHVRRFIAERRAEVLAGQESAPEDWETLLARPFECWGEPTSFELRFETTWGQGQGGTAGPFATGAVTRYLLDGTERAVGPSGVTAGLAGPKEPVLPEASDTLVVITLMAWTEDSTIRGVTVWLQSRQFRGGARLVIDRYPDIYQRPSQSGAVTWSVRPGATKPEHIVPVNTGTLELYAAGMHPGGTSPAAS